MSTFKVFCMKCKMDGAMLKLYPGTKVIRAFCQTPSCKNEDNLNHAEPPDHFVMPFGKYKGETISDIIETDPGYAEWAADNMENDKIRERFVKALQG